MSPHSLLRRWIGIGLACVLLSGGGQAPSETLQHGPFGIVASGRRVSGKPRNEAVRRIAAAMDAELVTGRHDGLVVLD